MNQAEAQRIISAIITNLRRDNPDFRGIISTVSDMKVEVGRWNLIPRKEPGEPEQRLDRKPSIILMHLEDLDAALSEGNVSKALEHAEAALLALD